MYHQLTINEELSEMSNNKKEGFVITKITIPSSWFVEIERLAKEEGLNTEEMIVKVLSDYCQRHFSLSMNGSIPDVKSEKSPNSKNVPH